MTGFIENIRTKIEDNPSYMKAFEILYRILPVETAIVYVMLLGMAWFGENTGISRMVFVPLAVFVGVTVIRKIINAPRPYEVTGEEPLIRKDTKGQSFPSRHVASAVIIAMTGFYMNVWVGITLMAVALLIAFARVVAGVHYIKDVTAGIIISVLAGIIGFFI